MTSSLSEFEIENNNNVILLRKFIILLAEFWFALLLWGLLAYDSICSVYCISPKGQGCHPARLAIFHRHNIFIPCEFSSMGFLTEMIVGLFNQLAAGALLIINICIGYRHVSLLLLQSTQKQFTIEEHFSKTHSVQAISIGLSEFWESAPQLSIALASWSTLSFQCKI